MLTPSDSIEEGLPPAVFAQRVTERMLAVREHQPTTLLGDDMTCMVELASGG